MHFTKAMLIVVSFLIVLTMLSCGDSDPSAVPAVPETLSTAPSLTGGDTTIDVSWTAVADATSYEVYCSDSADSASATLFTTTEDTSCTITGLTNGTTYYVWVKAKNSAGASDFSSAGSAAPAASGTWPAGVMQRGSDSTDDAIGMVKDNDGNVYVTGYSSGNLDPLTCTNAGGDDIYLVKYNASGEKQWTKMLGSDVNDRPYSIAYDGSDGIYITGYTRGNLDENTNTYDTEVMFITQFTTGGTKVWTKLYELPGSKGYGITFHDGYIYATGMSYVSGAYKFFIAKYNGVGVQQWIDYGAEGYNGLAVTLDASGNIYVTGSGASPSMFLFKYDTNGDVAWSVENTSYYAGRALVLDDSANIYLTGSTSDWHSFVEKYNSAGELQWSRSISSLFYPDGTNDIALDGSGNIYVTGGTRGDLDGQTNANNTNTTYDSLLIKYNAAGTRQWTQLLGTTAYDAGIGLTLFSDNSILVFGQTQGVLATPNGGGQDYFFAQYDASGELQ